MRFQVEARDVPLEQAAKRLGLTVAHFSAVLPALLAKGFPPADEITGNFDLDAIDAWRRRRNPHLFGMVMPPARDAASVVGDRLKGLRRG